MCGSTRSPPEARTATVDTRENPKREATQFGDQELRARQQDAWERSVERNCIGASRCARIAFRRSRGHGAQGLGAHFQDRRGVRPQAERDRRRARWPNRPPLRNRRLPHRAMPRRKRTRCPASYRIFRPRRARPRSRPSCRVNRAWRRWRQRLRAGNPASHINPSPAKDVELEKRTHFPSWIGFTCTTRALV